MVGDSADLFDALYNADLCAIVFSDDAGNITQINDYGAKIMGYPQTELIGKRVIEFTPEEDHPALENHILDLLQGNEQSVNVMHRVIRKDGTERWITGNLTSFHRPDGETMLESAFIDVTTEKLAEDRRDKTLEVMASVAGKYDSFYVCDLVDDSYKRINANKDRKGKFSFEEYGILSQAFEEFARTYISPDFQDIFSNFTSAEYIRTTLTGNTNSFEFEYCESKKLNSRWKLGELVGVSRDDDGLVTKFCFMVTDINDLKRREFERLRKNEVQATLVNIAFENSGIYDFTYHPQDASIICSERTCKALGCQPQFNGMPASFRDIYIDPHYYSVFDDMYARCDAGEVRSTAEFKDATGAHWFRTTLHTVEFDDNDKPVIAVGVVEKTDELHAARSEAATLQQICQFAVESHYEGLILVDTCKDSYSFIDLGNGIRSTWNGIDTSGNYDATIEIILEERAEGDDDRLKIESLLLKNLVPALKANRKSSIRYCVKDAEGQPRWKLVECTFFNNDIDEILMLITDIQQEEVAKQQLREALESADEANRAKSAFLANMSHEIRTPMNTIIGISEILMNKRLPTETLNEISTIQNAASGLLAIINDILDFSKIESGKFEITPVDYMLPSLLMDINNMISVRLVDRPVTFLINLDHNLPNHLIGDDIRIEQILMNLLGNAVKFTKEGFIELRITGEPVDEGSYKLVFKVIDSGIGIKEEDLGKLFGTFSQVDTTKNRSVTGSGLGLAISKSFAEMMGGGVAVESVYGKGTTFTVEVIQQVKFYEPIGEVRPEGIKMLICENDEVIISSISRTLENLGVEFRVCRELDKVRTYRNMTHVIIRRKRFLEIKEKLDFMFDSSNIYLILENGEQASSDFMEYKQLQLPLLCLQVINAFNGEAIANSYKRKNFDRSQIIPLTYAHVLIVDDNVTNLQVARGLMAPYQMQVDTATSGFKAIELAKSVKYDIIFMDHMMPEMDGLETTRHIRELPGDYYQKLPIVALTANAVSDAKELFLSNGLDDFLAKPIEMTELHRILKQYVQSKAPSGYLEDYLAKLSGKPEQQAAAPNAGLAFDVEMPGISLPLQGSGSFGQLLQQNTLLLQQNMLLLQGLLGKQAPGAMPSTVASTATGTAASTATGTAATACMQVQPMAENAGIRPDEATEIISGSIPEVNMTKALETYGGSVKTYQTILETYWRDISEREPALRSLYNSGDIENFTISVHAIKSASREVGADALGELAFQLEKAGSDGDTDFIKAHFERFMSELDIMRANVGTYVKTYVAPPSKARSSACLDVFPAQTVESLKDACENMDYAVVEEALDDLGQYSYPEQFETILATLRRYCAEFEYDKLEQLVKTL